MGEQFARAAPPNRESKEAKEDTMKLRILKPATLAGVGTFNPGTVVVIPNDVAEGWIRNGTARVEDGTPWTPETEAGTGTRPRKRTKSKAKPEAKPKTQIEPDPVPISE